MTGPTIAAPRQAEHDQIHLANAGLVLLHPFLPLFFERLGLLSTDGGALVAGLGAASKAVHLLQYLADGRLDRPASDLVLNKLLCGLDPAAPVEPAVEVGADEIALCNGLIATVVARWSNMGNISAAGLRETFLQREGTLRREGDGWTLTVQRKTVDVLLDRIPWSFAIVYQRWMREPLRVRW
ncbi:MAG TPA: contractile injection system tape measure protein [Aliidongia sp.]|nr:contractile injection system tape measure protein [Aliidongia sp.]